jgi:high frequency lysogenization protein
MNKDQIIALAGMFQAAYLVREIARTGSIDNDVYSTSIASIFKTDAATTAEVYGSLSGVQCGMRILATLYERETKPRDLELSRYVLSIVHLRKKLFRDKVLLDKLVQGIERAKSQSEVFSPTHENVIANLAQIYADTISQLQPRIVVTGEQGYLSNPDNAAKVRALLLALMRSAVLWHQKGGNRWQFIFSRGNILKMAKQML